MACVLLTERAPQHIDEVRRHPEQRWGAEVAQQYVAAIGEAFERLVARPRTLQTRSELSVHLRVLPVRSHVIADPRADVVVVLGLRHASMDIAAQLARFEPNFADEVALLVRRVANERRPT